MEVPPALQRIGFYDIKYNLNAAGISLSVSNLKDYYFDGAHFVRDVPCEEFEISWPKSELTYYLRLDFWMQQNARYEIRSDGGMVFSGKGRGLTSENLEFSLNEIGRSSKITVKPICENKDALFALLSSAEIVVRPASGGQVGMLLVLCVVLVVVLHVLLFKLFGLPTASSSEGQH